MKIAGTIFEKTKIFNFFLCELPLILRVDRKLKEKKNCKGILDIVNEIGQLV